jgi:hypothetical protein
MRTTARVRLSDRSVDEARTVRPCACTYMLTREPTLLLKNGTQVVRGSGTRWRADSGGAVGPKDRRQDGPALNKDDCSSVVFQEPKTLLKMLGPCGLISLSL